MFTFSRVLPYIIDLGSSNGTFLNNSRIEPQRYYELKEKDVIKFGYRSTITAGCGVICLDFYFWY